MDISFDPAKRAANLAKHGIDLADAAEVFAGLKFTMLDERSDYGEDRYITMGLLDGRMVVCVWTDRGDTRRIISLRKANDREEARFRSRFA